MERIDFLIIALIWPFVLILVILTFKKELKIILNRLSESIGSPSINHKLMVPSEDKIAINKLKNVEQNSKEHLNRLNYIVFTDIIYGVVIGITFVHLLKSFENFQLTPIVTLLFVYVLICDVWWGAHFANASQPFDQYSFLVEVFEILNYVFMAYLAYKSSTFFIITLVVYGLFGSIWDICWMRRIERGTQDYRIVRTWLIWSVVLSIVYSCFFMILIRLQVMVLSLTIVTMLICIFRSNRPPIPEHSGHLFQSKSAT